MDSNKVNWKKVSMIAATAAALLGIMVSWQVLDAPRWAWHSEVQTLEMRVNANQEAIVTLSWLKVSEELRRAEAEYEKTRSSILATQIDRLRTQLRNLQAKMDELSR